jgi:hypothetical protein
MNDMIYNIHIFRNIIISINLQIATIVYFLRIHHRLSLNPCHKLLLTSTTIDAMIAPTRFLPFHPKHVGHAPSNLSNILICIFLINIIQLIVKSHQSLVTLFSLHLQAVLGVLGVSDPLPATLIYVLYIF